MVLESINLPQGRTFCPSRRKRLWYWRCNCDVFTRHMNTTLKRVSVQTNKILEKNWKHFLGELVSLQFNWIFNVFWVQKYAHTGSTWIHKHIGSKKAAGMRWPMENCRRNETSCMLHVIRANSMKISGTQSLQEHHVGYTKHFLHFFWHAWFDNSSKNAITLNT